MNPDLTKLQAYPFERLRELKHKLTANPDLTHIPLSIGEPKHLTPPLIVDALNDHMASLAQYPLTRGVDELRETIADWLNTRFTLSTAKVHAESQVLPVNGTREALFAIAQCLIDRNQNPTVLMPNPFYQIYEGAAILAGAEPVYLPTSAETNYVPDFDLPAETWQRCQMLYICSPGNPTGAAIDIATLKNLIGLSQQYNFVIVADECYSEIYRDESSPPPGLLQACDQLGNHNFDRCLVFHSLSKRSNAPGLRSGFVAGDAALLKSFHQYRTYHGCAMPPPIQYASIAAWRDETHVAHNRLLYRQKFEIVINKIKPWFDISQPSGAFYLWLHTPDDDQKFARELFVQQNLTVLPGSFLSRDYKSINPGKNPVRIALVADQTDCQQVADRLHQFMQQNY